MSKNCKIGSFIWGGIFGAVIALLFAPKKGEELRENIFEKTMDILTDSQSVKEDFKNFVKNIKHEEDDLVDADSDIVISREFRENDSDDFMEGQSTISLNEKEDKGV